MAEEGAADAFFGDPIDDAVVADLTVPPFDPAGVSGGLMGTINGIARQMELLTVAVDTLRSVLTDRIFAFEDTLSATWKSQVEAVDEYRAHVDEGVAFVRGLATQNNVHLRNIEARVDALPTEATAAASAQQSSEQVLAALAANGESLAAARQALTELVGRVSAEPEAPQGVPEELALFMDETRESVDVLAAATQANATVFADLMRFVREVKASADTRAKASSAESAVLAELVESVHALSELTARAAEAAEAAEAAVQVEPAEPVEDDGTLELLERLSAKIDKVQRVVAKPPATDVLAELVESVQDLSATVAQLPTEAPATVAAPSEIDLRPIVHEFGAFRDAQDVLVAQIVELREEVVRLKRRVPVRGSSSSAASGLRDDDIERIVASVVARLETMFEVVPDS